ncbi:MAG TPA: DUF5990 family protein [Thermoanaerobaculia bacterium]|nr:DUF5990 family protein [Thermoanaerobaculia bacterium]
MPAEPTTVLPLRIRLLAPPPRVAWALQLGRSELVPPTRTDAEGLTFDFEVRLGPRVPGEPPRFLGPATQGPPHGRFVYLNSGMAADQFGSPWTRRAKIPLGALGWDLIAQHQANPGSRLEASIQGGFKDGSPVCATVKQFARGWEVAPEVPGT